MGRGGEMGGGGVGGEGVGMLMVAVRVSVDVRDGRDSGERGAGL